jgi:hypothetical protein
MGGAPGSPKFSVHSSIPFAFTLRSAMTLSLLSL